MYVSLEISFIVTNAIDYTMYMVYAYEFYS